MLVEHQQSYIFSSDSSLGAVNVSNDGSTFTINLNTPLAIPKEAIGATTELIGASIWYNTANISAALGNNQFRYIVSGTPESFVIDDGLYSLSALNAVIERELVNAGYASDLIVLSGDDATQFSVFTFGAIGVQVDMLLADTPYVILGFDNRLVPLLPSTVVGQSELGDRVASFNVVESYLVHSSMVASGVPVNGNGANILSDVPIDVGVGRQIVFSPRNPRRTTVNELVGHPVGSFRFWLTSQNSDFYIDTRGETWSCTVLIRYFIPVESINRTQ
jgi:hypothetical protein